MAISHVGSVADGTANRTTSSTITLNFATAAGDWIFVVATNGGANADPTIGGTVVSTGGVSFSKVEGLNGGGTTTLTGILWAGKATGNHNTQTVVVSGATNSCASALTVLRGAHATTPVLANSSILNASGTNTLAALTSGSTSGCWLVLGLSTDDDIVSSNEAAATTPTTITERAEHQSTGGNDTCATICAEAFVGTGTTGGLSWTNARGAGIYQIPMALVIQPETATSIAITPTSTPVTAVALGMSPGGVSPAVTPSSTPVTAQALGVTAGGVSLALTPVTVPVGAVAVGVTAPAPISLALSPTTMSAGPQTLGTTGAVSLSLTGEDPNILALDDPNTLTLIDANTLAYEANQPPAVVVSLVGLGIVQGFNLALAPVTVPVSAVALDISNVGGGATTLALTPLEIAVTPVALAPAGAVSLALTPATVQVTGEALATTGATALALAPVEVPVLALALGVAFGGASVALSPVTVAVLGVTLDLVREAMGGGFPPFLSTAFDVQHNGSTLAVSSSSELQVSPAYSGAFAVRSTDSGDFEVCHD